MNVEGTTSLRLALCIANGVGRPPDIDTRQRIPDLNNAIIGAKKGLMCRWGLGENKESISKSLIIGAPTQGQRAVSDFKREQKNVMFSHRQSIFKLHGVDDDAIYYKYLFSKSDEQFVGIRLI